MRMLKALLLPSLLLLVLLVVVHQEGQIGPGGMISLRLLLRLLPLLLRHTVRIDLLSLQTGHSGTIQSRLQRLQSRLQRLLLLPLLLLLAEVVLLALETESVDKLVGTP